MKQLQVVGSMLQMKAKGRHLRHDSLHIKVLEVQPNDLALVAIEESSSSAAELELSS